MEQFQPLGKILILIGIVLFTAGVLLLFADKIPLFGKLPGDIIIRRKSFTLFFPIATCIALSLILTLILYLIRK